ncbi:DUF192 domain-containing protein [Natrinema halophilum]|uniref:DUF192 domain-containing protein n=1 Tax=Natrinema halophilum TaxID=1699371 RepID=A0A7D5KEY6_9EURY|nr:DUF192 domain-containing protein [Natrinema halophilum]QLG50636.1 DUF192 domain-containing protein [Natrinema halophilum]
MSVGRGRKALLVVAILSISGVALVQAGIVSGPWSPEKGEARIVDPGTDTDEPKAVVDVEIADSYRERYTGLSDHESLESGNGMLFVYDHEQDLTYVMREMNFDIDIIYIGADREITSIHHARAPEPGEDGNDLTYSGRGKWVLEVPRGYTNETGIEVGDEVEIDLESKRTIIGWAGASTGGMAGVASTANSDTATQRAARRATNFDSSKILIAGGP